MPGFNVSGVGDAKGNSSVTTYYTYTWQVEQIFDDRGTEAALIYLKDATFPSIKIKTEEATGTALVYKFASEVSWEDCRVVWYDVVGLASFVKKWRESVWTPTEGLKTASAYKKQSILTKLTGGGIGGDGIGGGIQGYVKWTLHNSWPSSIKEGDLTYTSSEIKVVEVSLTYDWADEVIFPPTT